MNIMNEKETGMTFVDEQAPVGWDKVSALDARRIGKVEEQEAARVAAMPPRAIIRQHKAMHRKILKKTYMGHTPRRIAHELGYMNVDQGEREVRQIIGNYLK